MPQGMVLDDELCRHGSSEAQRKGRRCVQLLVGKTANRVCGLATILAKEFQSLGLGHARILTRMFGIKTGDCFPRDVGDSVAACDGPVSYTHLRAHETGRNLVCR